MKILTVYWTDDEVKPKGKHHICRTCRFKAGYGIADGPSGPEDGVNCTSQAMVDYISAAEAGPFRQEEFDHCGFTNLWRIDVLEDMETLGHHTCPGWLPNWYAQRDLVDKASDAFWAVVVEEFPDIRTGDFDMDGEWERFCCQVIDRWLCLNKPTTPLVEL